jgi:hypothetical protein
MEVNGRLNTQTVKHHPTQTKKEDKHNIAQGLPRSPCLHIETTGTKARMRVEKHRWSYPCKRSMRRSLDLEGNVTGIAQVRMLIAFILQQLDARHAMVQPPPPHTHIYTQTNTKSAKARETLTSQTEKQEQKHQLRTI